MGLIFIFVAWLSFDLICEFFTSEENKAPKQEQKDVKKQEQKSSEVLEKEKTISELEEEIRKVKEESLQYNNPSNYAKYSKMQRRVITLENKLEEEKKNLRALPQTISSNEISKIPEELLHHEKGGLLQNKAIISKVFRVLLPALLVFLVPESFISVRMDSSYFAPFINFFGEQQGPLFQITRRTTWVVLSMRAVNRIRKVIKSLILTNKQHQNKLKVD